MFSASKYKNVRNYIKKWHKEDHEDINSYWENFQIYENADKTINLNETLHNMNPEILIKVAVDLWIETPGFIPAIPVIKNVLKNNYGKAFDSFQQALKQVEENPDLSVGLANSTLEGIIKHIWENDNISTKFNNKDTLYKLTDNILKEFELFPDKQMPNEIRVIWSGLMSLSQHIEDLRSWKTQFHWSHKAKYIIDDPLYAYFIVNSISTIGLFLMGFYEKKYNNKNVMPLKEEPEEEINIEDIPF